MTPEEFNSKLQHAAVVHNIALIHRRTSDPENYQKAIESYEQALELYISCHHYYNAQASRKGYPKEASTQLSNQNGALPSINLELKIAQTLQSLAKLHIKLNTDYLAVKAHEDAINLLLEGGNKQDTQSPPSPTTVTANIVNVEKFQVISLGEHERTRIIVTSLSSLAQIYFTQEMKDPEYNLQEEEDGLTYYHAGLNTLKGVENPVSTTRIPALSNEKSPNPLSLDEQDEMNAYASDANQTPSTSTTYKIDLRKEVVSTLLAMAVIYKRRNFFQEVVHSYEQARDVHLLLNSDQKDQEMIESLLALAYEKNGDLQKALVCYQHVLKVRKTMFGEKSIQVGNLYASMSNLNRRMADLAQSLGWNKRAISIYTEHCENSNGTDSPLKFQARRHLIGNMQNQGGLYVQMNEVDRAIVCYLTVIEKQVEFQGEEHPDVATTLNVLGDLYMSKKEYSEAKASFDRALTLYRKYGVGNDDPDLVSTLQCLCKVEDLIGDESKTRAGKNIRNHHKTKTIPPPPADSSPPHCLPFRPPVSRHSSQEKEKGPEDRYINFNVVETNPSFFDDDDALSQITFVTHQPEAPSVSNQSYRTIEEKLENWSPAEYVFRAVDKLANATEEFANDLFSGPKISRPSKPARMGSLAKVEKRRRAQAAMQNELESLDEGYEVREFQSRISTPVPTGVFNTLSISEPSKKSQKTPEFENSSLNMASSQSCDSSSASARRKTVQEKKEATSTADYRETQQTCDENRFSSPPVQMSYMHSDDSVAAGTEATSVLGSLAGMDFINDASVAGTQASVAGTQASTLYGANFADNDSVGTTSKESVPLQNEVLRCREDAIASTRSAGIVDMDTMLAQMNVVTCDMEGKAKPFQEMLKGEGYDLKRVRSKTKQNKTFEKLSACLGMLDNLMDKFGPDHGKVIQTQSTLASLYLENGNDEKGIKKYCQVLELQNKKFGRNSTQVAETHVKLGQHWTKKNEIDKAIDSFSTAKEIDTYLFGKNHPQIAQHLNSIGMAELERGEFDAAMDYLQSALQIQQMHLAPNEINPDVSLTYVNIGAVYYKERNCLKKIRSNSNSYKNFIQSGMLGKIAFAHSERGEYVEAMHFYREVLELQKSGADSVHQIAATHNCLGELNVKAGRYMEALDHHTLALKMIEDSMNTNELDICNTKCDQGVVYYHLGNFKKATTVLESACSIQRQVLGNHHCRVAKTMYHLAIIRRIRYDIDPSLHLLNEAVKIQLSTIGQSNPDTISSQLEVAKSLLDFDEIDEAIMQLERVFEVQRNILGNEHPDLVETLHCVGICYARKNDETRAMNYFEQCYRMQLKVCKLDCPSVACTKDEIGLVLLKQGKTERAFQAFQDSLRIRREIGEDHYEVAYSLFNIGLYFTSKRKYVDALKCFKDAMRISVVAFGLDHPFIGDIHWGVGNVNTRKCNFDEAQSEFTLALKIYDKCMVPKSHYRVTKCEADLKRVQLEESLCV